MDQTAHHPVIGNWEDCKQVLPITHYLLAITGTTPLPKYGRIPQNFIGVSPQSRL
ncbi:hypothetical protein [Fischerella thermalis]|uniref:hypothetical protein n=1 Tax=Fischerella thermalis TaxID=372787 RepID=UPI00307EB871